jgi:hypothetical protein
MNRITPAIVIGIALGIALAFASSPVSACGEGQFNMGQGLRYQGYLAPRPATVLVYDQNASDHKSLYAGLQKAGHTVTVVGTADAMSQALHVGRYDIVIADFDDAAALKPLVTGRATKASVLPVVARNRRNAPEVTSRFKFFLLDGASLGQYLKGINQLVSVRIK